MKAAAFKHWKRKQLKVYKRYSSKVTSKFKKKRNLTGKYVILLLKRKSKNAALLKFISQKHCNVEAAVIINRGIIRQTSSKFIIIADKNRKLLRNVEVTVRKSFKQEYEGICLNSRKTKRAFSSKLYSCSTCNHKFTRLKIFNEHALSHAKLESSDSERELVIDEDVMFVVDDQEETITSSPKETLSLEPDIRAEEYCCMVQNCQQKFETEEMLISHIGLQHNIRNEPFKCNKCDKSFNQESGLLEHEKVFHPITLNDPAKRERRKSIFIPTVEAINGIRSTEKNTCSKPTETKRVVSFNLYDSSNKKLFVCRICSASFSQRSVLDRHMSVFHISKLHYCFKCNVPYFSNRLLNHVKTAHPNTENEPGYIKMISNIESIAVHRCAFCIFTSPVRSIVIDHLKNEHYDEFEKEIVLDDEQASSPDSLENLILPETAKILSAKEEELRLKTKEKIKEKYQNTRKKGNDPTFKFRCARCLQSYATSTTMRKHSCSCLNSTMHSTISKNIPDFPDKEKSLTRITAKAQLDNQGFYVCPLCPHVFTCREMFDSHVLTGHSQT